MDELTKDEKALLLYIESRAVDNRSGLNGQQLNETDHDILKKWNDLGFVEYGRISYATRPRCGSTHWAILSEDAWQAAHTERRARAERMAEKRTWLTTEEARNQ